MRIIIVLLISLFVTSCACNLPKQVKIPVAVKQPSPNIPPKPYLPIAKLTNKSPANDTIKAYVVSVEILQGYSNELTKLLEVYQ